MCYRRKIVSQVKDFFKQTLSCKEMLGDSGTAF
jgi:hypothetical protein